MYKFNNDNIITGYIKQLLKDFNLPKCKVFKPGMPIFKDNIYIYENKLLKAAYTKQNGTTLSDFSKIDNYLYNEKYLNLTKNLELKNLLYDSYTHRYLGDYLRFYRDYKNINLMPLYNCFNNESPKNLNINSSNFTFNSLNDDYKLYMIPIKYFQDYTIAIDCLSSVELIVGYYSTKSLDIIMESESDTRISYFKNSYMLKSNTQFNKPFLYSKDNIKFNDINNSNLANQEINLKLFIKLPIECTSAITVLEGNYADTVDINLNTIEKYCFNFEDQQRISAIAEKYFNNDLCLSKLKLLDVNSKISYPFSDKLLEYLFNNAITSDDVISDNIKKVQKTLARKTTYGIKNYGIWDNEMSLYLYSLLLRDNKNNLLNNTFDNLFYVDKDIEEKLGDLMED